MRVPTFATLALFGLLAPCSNVARADELADTKTKPRAEKRFHRQIFWLGATSLALSKSWDAATTVACLDRSSSCRERQSAWAVGARPTRVKLALFDSGVFAASTTSFLFTERTRKPWLRWTGRLLIAASIAGATRMGFHNRGVCYPVSVCSPSGHAIP